jgi:methionyl aminopeptidase
MWKILIKTPEQIDGIRKASKLTASVLDMIGSYVRPWISTLELDNIMNAFIIKNGWVSACIDYQWANKWGKSKHSYPRYNCISLNDVVCHGIPRSDEILKEGDILNIDVTTIVDGYFWDASRMYSVGKISEKAEKLIQVTKQCLEIGIAQVRPGNFYGNIWYEIDKYATSEWFSVVRDFTGHGVWVHFHEEPYVHHRAARNSGPKMEKWMIFTIEPMINAGKWAIKIDNDEWTARTKDASLSAQWEHTLLVTEKWCEILTKSTSL